MFSAARKPCGSHGGRRARRAGRDGSAARGHRCQAVRAGGRAGAAGGQGVRADPAQGPHHLQRGQRAVRQDRGHDRAGVLPDEGLRHHARLGGHHQARGQRQDRRLRHRGRPVRDGDQGQRADQERGPAAQLRQDGGGGHGEGGQGDRGRGGQRARRPVVDQRDGAALPRALQDHGHQVSVQVRDRTHQPPHGRHVAGALRRPPARGGRVGGPGVGGRDRRGQVYHH
mmetsp:Transcript_55422/g.146133  ORF Transcript_55422/g.146133 Transcript_55422/m.146133 type:complete len:227 (+) Transcript_55422:432-1112(+)